MTTDAGLRIFISYRRSDCQPQANALSDGLGHRLTDASVFMDIDSIPVGVDFEDHIRGEIAACDLVLVLIGDNWLDPIDEKGARRIDEPGDFVRLEIENALSHPDVALVPVLVEGAQMPGPHQLPESIGRLARINAIELSDRRWRSDIDRLADVIERMGKDKARQTVSLRDLNQVVIEAAVQQAYPPFQTKDISEAPAVVAAHGDVARARNFATMVGTYVAKNAATLGLQSAGKGPGDRGETWQRAPITVAPPLAPPPAQPTTPAFEPALPSQAPQASGTGTSSPVALVALITLIAVSVGTLGLMSWLPFVIGLTRPHPPRIKKQIGLLLALNVVCLITGFALFGAAPEDATGSVTGPLPWIGFLLLCSAGGLGVLAAVRYRKVA